LKKGVESCQEVTEQVLAAKGPVWDEARAKVEAKWAGRLPQDRAEIVFVRTVEQRLLMLSDSPVMRQAVLSVGIK
jgi:hypothetical protein